MGEKVSGSGTYLFFFSSRRRHTRSVSAFLLNRSSDLLMLLLVWLIFFMVLIKLLPILGTISRQIRANPISFTVFPEIVPSIGNSFINTMKNINHTRSSISDDIRNILCSSANMRRDRKRRVGKSVDLGGRSIIKKKKKKQTGTEKM